MKKNAYMYMGLNHYSADIVLKILSALGLEICCMFSIIALQTTFSMKANNMKSDQTIWAHIIGVAPIMHMRNKNSNIQWRLRKVVKVIYHTIRNCS